MHRIALALASLVLCATAGTALAAEPQHFTSSEHDVFVDDTCSFPILADLVFTNDVTEWDNADGTVDRLQLHQSFVGTWSGNGVTLSENDHEQTFVTFTAGAPTQAKHVGLTFHLQGPDGKIFDIAGQEVFTVVHGFDHDLLAAHGIDVDFDPVTYCAAFADEAA